jgi:hypothetical protein
VTQQVEYIEFDLDKYFATQFEKVRAGETVPDWVNALSVTPLIGMADTAFRSGKIARSVMPGGMSDNYVWAPSIANPIEDVSVLTHMRMTPTIASPSAFAVAQIFLRASTDTGTRYAFIVSYDGAQKFWEFARYNSFVFQSLAGGLEIAPSSFNAELPLWVLFEAVTLATDSVFLRAKVWNGLRAEEPALFQYSVEDSFSPSDVIAVPGCAGFTLFAPTLTATLDVGMFRFQSLFGSSLETVRHAMPANYSPLIDVPAIPDIKGVSFSPGQISLGQDLGKRSSLNVTFGDHKHADLGEFFHSGSHWAKMRQRGLLRRGVPVRRRVGKLGDSLDVMETRHFVLESFDGPKRDGTFSATAQDVLKLVDDDKAQAPRPSRGFLSATLAAGGVSTTLLPSGIGDLEYPASGIAAIGGSEIVTFTRSGDTFSIVRGQFNTIAQEHASEDRFQLCKQYSAADPADIVDDLFRNYSGVPAEQIPLSTWKIETGAHLQRVYTRLIADPTGVRKLVSELCEQAGLVIWPDDISNQIRLQVLRGIPTTAFLYDEDNTLEGSIQPADQPGKGLTEVWTYYGTINPLEPLDQPDNFRSSLITTDSEAEAINGVPAIKKIFATWIAEFGRSTAQRINDIHLARFRITRERMGPRRINFDVMRHSGVQVPDLGGGYRIGWQGNQDECGEPVAAPIQITRLNPMADRYACEAEEMIFGGVTLDDPNSRVIPIDANISNINLRELHDSIYPPLTEDDLGSPGVSVTFIIAAGVIVGSNSTSMPACDVGMWLAGFTPHLQVLGRIQGHGGDGRSLVTGGGPPEPDGFPGGPALYTRNDVTVDASSGEIWGGGGGGALAASGAPTFLQAAGGGGAGKEPGVAGTSFLTSGTEAQDGTTEAGGDGASQGALNGGDGGDPGQSAGAASGGMIGDPGAAGSAIDGIAFVTFTTSPSGDIRGPTV